jgi:hypothetical protein
MRIFSVFRAVQLRVPFFLDVTLRQRIMVHSRFEVIYFSSSSRADRTFRPMKVSTIHYIENSESDYDVTNFLYKLHLKIQARIYNAF